MTLWQPNDVVLLIKGTKSGERLSNWLVGTSLTPSPNNRQPRPVYLEVPDELRMLWNLQKERSKTGVQTDIFEIEAIGPLIALLTWPQLLADRPWIHFIDNNTAQGAIPQRLFKQLER